MPVETVLGLERFWNKVDKDGPVPESRPDLGPCWIWRAAKIADGYGVIGFAGKSRYAHRLAYEALVGPIPVGLCIDHLCRVRNCVNPDHMEPVTNEENTRRGLGPAMIRNEYGGQCQNGHDLNTAGIYVGVDGGRRCMECRRIHRQRWRDAQKTKVAISA